MQDERSDAGEELTLDPATVGPAPRRRALWGALAAAALAVGALAVVSGDDGGSLRRLPIALGADSRNDEASGVAADMPYAAVHYVAGDDLPTLGGDAPAYRLHAVIDASAVSTLADALGLSGTPVHEDRVWRVESAEGLLEVVQDGGGSWWYSTQQRGEVGVGGGTADCPPDATDCQTVATAVAEPSGTVAPSAAGGSSEPAPPPATEPDCSDAKGCTTVTSVECDADGTCVEPTPTEPTPPADLPSKEEARQLALDLLAATGAPVADATVTVDGPYDAWYVNVEHRIDGVPVSGWASSVAVGSKGAVLYANGLLGRPDALGDYPLLDTRAAIDRLNEQQSSIGYATDDRVQMGAPEASDAVAPSSGALEDDAAAREAATQECVAQPDGSELCAGSSTVDPAETTYTTDTTDTGSGAGGSTGTVVVDEPVPAPDEPVPDEPPVTTEPMEVVLTDAEHALVLVGAVDGSGDAYIVPAYRFSNDDGWMVDTLAVADDGLVPTTETTVPKTTEDTGSDGVVPPPTGPVECKVLVEDDGSGTTHTIQTCPGTTEAAVLEEGASPELGVAYRVDQLNTHCGWFVWAERWWATDAQTPLGWASQAGTFTLSTTDEGTFVGDAGGTDTATFTARGPAAEEPLCA